MIRMRLRDGTYFDPLTAAWTVTPKGSEAVFGWEDIAVVEILDPICDVMNGTFGQARMPVRGLRFADLSDLVFEVPLPLEAAQEIGKLLAVVEVEAVRTMPAGLVRPPKLNG